MKTQSQHAPLHPFLFMFTLRHTVKCMCGNLWWQSDSDVSRGFQCIYKLDMFQDRQCTCNVILWHFHLQFIPPHPNSIIHFHSNLCLWQQWVLGIVELNIMALEMQQCISFILQTHICRVAVNNINTERIAMEMQQCILFGTAVELKLL
jgi:hypothetical protein